jgi:TonB family protein
MKKVVLSVILASLIFTVSGQDKKEGSKYKVKAGFGLSVVQVQPEYPGGPDSLQSFLNRNLEYPEKAKADHIGGRIYVSFRVDEKGKIIDPKVISGITEDLDAEALRVVKLMPDWKPGTASGQPVKVQYVLPIDFVIPRN